jgi:hypothetical protein
MAKLHEILAVEADKDNAAKVIAAETANTFTKGAHHFMGQTIEYSPFDENALDASSETKEMDTTVKEKLEYFLKSMVQSVDVTASKDATNQVAIADLEVNGVVVAKDLPATTLLTLETKVKAWFEVFKHIPTLAPGRKWEKDVDKGKDVYIDVNPSSKFRTQRTTKHKILVEPTEFHPAQIDKWEVDERIGKITETIWSGMFSPAEKSDLLKRTQDLICAIKQARQRANSTTVVQKKIGQELVKYLLG